MKTALRQFSEMLNHDVWSSGAQLSHFGGGLKASLVDTSLTVEKDRKKAEAIFGYDGTIVQNPVVMPKAEVVCSLKHGGLCSKDEILPVVELILKQLYKMMKSAKLNRKSLPILVDLMIPVTTITKCFLLTYSFAAGEFFAGLRIVADTLQLDERRFKLDYLVEHLSRKKRGNSFSLHCELKGLLREGTRALGITPRSVRATAFNIEDCCAAEFVFCVRPEHKLFDVCLHDEAKPKTEKVGKSKSSKADADASWELPWGLGMGASTPADVKPSIPDSKKADLDDKLGDPSDSDVDPEGMERDSQRDSLSDQSSGAESSSSSSSSSSTVVEEEKPAPPVVDVVVEPAPIPAPPTGVRILPVGFVEIEKAKTSRALCHYCSLAVPKDEWKVRYRIKASKTMADVRSVHLHCVNRLPLVVRESDYRAVQHLVVADDGLDPYKTTVLENLETALRPYGAASGSGH